MSSLFMNMLPHGRPWPGKAWERTTGWMRDPDPDYAVPQAYVQAMADLTDMMDRYFHRHPLSVGIAFTGNPPVRIMEQMNRWMPPMLGRLPVWYRQRNLDDREQVVLIRVATWSNPWIAPPEDEKHAYCEKRIRWEDLRWNT